MLYIFRMTGGKYFSIELIRKNNDTVMVKDKVAFPTKRSRRQLEDKVI